MNAAQDNDVTIRTYQPGDRDACRALWAELTEWHRFIYESPTIGGSDPGRQFDAHLERVGPDHIWVAEVDGQPVGLAGLIQAEGQAELEPIIVSPPYRGLGIGARLAQVVLEAARAAGAPQLVVRPVARNVQAIQFFHALGFDVLGHLELFTDFAPAENQRWRAGERLADREFRV